MNLTRLSTFDFLHHPIVILPLSTVHTPALVARRARDMHRAIHLHRSTRLFRFTVYSASSRDGKRRGRRETRELLNIFRHDAAIRNATSASNSSSFVTLVVYLRECERSVARTNTIGTRHLPMCSNASETWHISREKYEDINYCDIREVWRILIFFFFVIVFVCYYTERSKKRISAVITGKMQLRF